MLKRKGRTVLSADEIGNTLANKDRSVRSRIQRAFGEQVYGTDGKLDRSQLAAKVFRSPALLARLNAIIHPAVLRSLQQSITQLPQKQKIPYVVIESALIYEAGLETRFDFVVLVDAPLTLRITRSSRSTGHSKAEIRRRAQSQLPAMSKRRLADFVLVNKGTVSGLERKARFLDDTLSRIAESSKKTY